jgi:hypothetical protein
MVPSNAEQRYLDSPPRGLAEVQSGPPDPRMKAAAESARRGIAILRAGGATPKDLAWAEDILAKVDA